MLLDWQYHSYQRETLLDKSPHRGMSRSSTFVPAHKNIGQSLNTNCISNTNDSSLIITTNCISNTNDSSRTAVAHRCLEPVLIKIKKNRAR